MVDVIGRAKVVVETAIDKSSLGQAEGKLGTALRRGAVVGVAALGTLAAAGVKASLAFEEAESVSRKLSNTLGNMGKSGAVEEVEKLSASLMRQTGIDDEVIKKGQTILATFSEVASSAGKLGGAFERATELSADLSVSGFGSMDSAAKALGKALQDPEKGITALSRAGVTFTPVQKQQIEDFVKGGEVAKAQGIILDEVAKQVGGNAEAGAKGSDKLRNAFGELEEAFGNVLNTVTGGDNFSGLAESLQDIADQIDRFADSEGLRNFVDAFQGEDPVGTGTVLAPGADPTVQAPLSGVLDEQLEDAGATGAEKFWDTFAQRMRELVGGTGRNFELFGELIEDISDGGLVDSVSNVLEEWEKDFDQWFEDAKQTWRDGWEDITDIWPDIQAAFEKDWDNLKTGFSDTWDDIKTGAADFVEDLKSTGEEWAEAGQQLIGDFVRGLGGDIGNSASRIARNIKDAINQALPDTLTFFGKKGGLPAITVDLPELATGARNFSGGLALVGERGPEIVGLPAGSDVYSTQESRRMLGGETRGGDFNYYNYGPVSGSDILDQYKWANRFSPRFGALSASVAG